MKILTRKNARNNDAGPGEEALSNGSGETSFEIPNSTIAGLGTILTLILTFATGIAPNLITWAINAPKDRIDIEAKEVASKLPLLKQALQSKTAQERANSIKLLINAGLLKDPNGELMKQANNPEQLPLWDQPSGTPQSPVTSTGSPSATNTPQSSPSATPVR